MAASGDGNDGDEDQWRFSLEDLEDDEDDDRGTGAAGTLAPSKTIEPGDIDPENAFFVLLGVLIASLLVGSYLLVAL